MWTKTTKMTITTAIAAMILGTSACGDGTWEGKTGQSKKWFIAGQAVDPSQLTVTCSGDEARPDLTVEGKGAKVTAKLIKENGKTWISVTGTMLEGEAEGGTFTDDHGGDFKDGVFDIEAHAQHGAGDSMGNILYGTFDCRD